MLIEGRGEFGDVVHEDRVEHERCGLTNSRIATKDTRGLIFVDVIEDLSRSYPCGIEHKLILL